MNRESTAESNYPPNLSPLWLTSSIAEQFGTGKTLIFGSCSRALISAFLSKGLDCNILAESNMSVKQGNEYFPNRFFNKSQFNDSPNKYSANNALVFLNSENINEEDLNALITKIYQSGVKHLLFSVKIDITTTLTSAFYETRTKLEYLSFKNGYRKSPFYMQFLHEFNSDTPKQLLTCAFERDSNFSIAITRYKNDFFYHSEYDYQILMWYYQIAADIIRPGDYVLDAQATTGAGLYYLSQNTNASLLKGFSSTEMEITYARNNLYLDDKRVSLTINNNFDLSTIQPNSIDLAIYLSLPHSPGNWDNVLNKFLRVLKPGGRIILGTELFERDSSDQSIVKTLGNWHSLRSKISNSFRVENGYGFNRPQRGHPKEPLFFSFNALKEPTYKATSWLICAMKDPILGDSIPYTEKMYPNEQPPENIISFSRDYTNPWLVHSMVSLPWRLPGHALKRLTEDVLDTSKRSSTEYAAALCVKGYRLLGEDNVKSEIVIKFLSEIKLTLTTQDQSGHPLRWQISNSYLAALLAAKIGDFKLALEYFHCCSQFDCRIFSVTLATKTISASYWAGKFSLIQGNPITAKIYFNRGIEIYFSLYENGRKSFLGEQNIPFDLPYFEMLEILYALASCNHALRECHNNPENALKSIRDPRGNIQAKIRQQKDLPKYPGAPVSTDDDVLKIFWKVAQSKSRQLVIYGAGEFGQLLLDKIKHMPIETIAIIDSNPDLHSTTIHGVPVYGPETLPDIVTAQTTIAIASKAWSAEIRNTIETLFKTQLNPNIVDCC